MAKVTYENKEHKEKLTLEVKNEKEAISVFASLIVRREMTTVRAVNGDDLKEILEDLELGTTRN